MSSRSLPPLFETTHSALLLPHPPTPSAALPGSSPEVTDKSSLDKNFWILRELGRRLALVDHGVTLLDLARCPVRIPT